MQIELKELHAETGLTTVFVTHDQSEALSLSDRIVVMSRGEIQQVSTPLELYRRPANGFVASFVGEINRLPPAQVAAAGAELRLALPGGITLTARRPADPDLRPGETLHVFVRPEAVAIAAADGPAANRFAGRVATHIFQGAHTLTRVEVAGLGVLELRVPGGEVIERSPVGSEVAITVRLDDAVMLRE
jgi:putative spermidine/putrescine transport system ATP-binding protein